MNYGPPGRYGSTYREPAPRPRYARLKKAREKGTHTKDEWEVLHSIFNECVCCGVPKEYLHGNALCKDHIQPITAGGCDCIGNLQPVCRECNSRGINADLRNNANPTWCSEYIKRMW